MSSASTVLFSLCATVAVLSACGTIASRTPIRSALSLFAHILSLALLYLTLHAHLLAAMQLIVYAGAIVVLFVFVIMLIGPAREEMAPPGWRSLVPRVVSVFLMGAVTVSLAAGVGQVAVSAPKIAGCPEGVAECNQFGGLRAVARSIYVDGVVPFELLAVLLVIAILGAIAVARGRTLREQRRVNKARQEASQLTAEASAPGGN